MKTCGWSDEDYRFQLRTRYNALTSTELSQSQIRDFVDFMRNELGEQDAVPTLPPSACSGSFEYLTQYQRKTIVDMWWKICRASNLSEKRMALHAFIKRQTGCDDLRFVLRKDGPALICALKTMIKNKEKVYV